MIKYNLKCHQNHIFEAWFKNSSAYDTQAERGIVTCSTCGSTNVEKAIMAPSLPQKANRTAAPTAVQTNDTEAMATALAAIKELRKTVESNCDDVGTQFAEEARKIHYGEADKRGIYGEATEDQKAELVDEGVEIATLPWVPTSDA